MTVMQVIATVSLVSPAGSVVATLKPVELAWTEDEGAAPSIIATTVVAMPTALQFAMLRPGAGYYLQLTGDQVGLPMSTPRLLRIVSRERTMDGRVRLQATSAETDLQAFMPSVADMSNWAKQGSVPAIITNVCNKVFGSAWARYTYSDAVVFGQDIGTPTYPTYRGLANLIPNPGFEYGLNGWVPANVTMEQSASWKQSGTFSLMLTPTSATNAASRAEIPVDLKPDTTYTLSGVHRGWSAAQGGGIHPSARAIVVVGSISGVDRVLATTQQAPNFANTTTQLRVTFTTPSALDSGASLVRLYNGSTTTNGRPCYFDELMLIEGGALETDYSTGVAYFDGDTPDGTSGYNYDWQGDPGISPSARTPILDRDPDSLTWSPGQSAWDFLQPILQASDVHLWSAGYAVLSGRVVAMLQWSLNAFGLNLPAPRALETQNLFEVAQTDSWSAEFPDGTPMYADQVILRYSWTDSFNETREAFDVYPATGKKPYYLELQDTPFAGIGRARGIYNRISARATMLEGSMWFNRAVQIGKQLAVTAAAVGGSAVGYIDAVTHDPFRGITTFRTKQTIGYTAVSWFTATGSWAAQTGSWADDK